MDPEPSCLRRRVDSRLARGWLFVAVLGALCATAGPAWGSFPGGNGTIVYGWLSASKEVDSPTSIRAVDPRSGRVRVLRDCPLDAYPAQPRTDCQVSVPRYSPDGLRIAFPSAEFAYPPGGGRQIRPGVSLMATDGTGFEEHTGAHSYQRLSWSPAGDQFLLERTIPVPEYAQPSAIFLASLDGTELSQVTRKGSGAPDWASTGEIAFVRYRVSCVRVCSDIYLTRLGGTPHRLTYRGGSSPSWSPHGTKLAFVRSVRRDHADVYLVRRDGSGLRRLTRRGGHSPAWSPDGRWIAFIRDGDLYAVRTNGRRLRRLVDELGPDETYFLGPRVVSVDWQAIQGATE